MKINLIIISILLLMSCMNRSKENDISYIIVAFPGRISVSASASHILKSKHYNLERCKLIKLLENVTDDEDTYSTASDISLFIGEATNETVETFYFAIQLNYPAILMVAEDRQTHKDIHRSLRYPYFACTNISKYTQIEMNGDKQPLPIYLKRGAYVFCVDGDKVTGTRVAPWSLKEQEL